MITHLLAGIVGLLVFFGMILSGYFAGNSFATIIIRALAGMAGGFLVGYLCGYFLQLIINEHVEKSIAAEADVRLGSERIDSGQKTESIVENR